MADNPYYPLRWPPGWPRTPANERSSSSRFKADARKIRSELAAEVRKLGGTDVMISSNVAVRYDGTPYADQARRRIDDPGVAVYFQINGLTKVMARDQFERPEDNLRDIGLAIRDMRSLELHGGATMMARAFEGFTALPPPDSCWKILGIPQPDARTTDRGVQRQRVLDAFRIAAKEAHDNGGFDADMGRLVKARDDAIAELSARKS